MSVPPVKDGATPVYQAKPFKPLTTLLRRAKNMIEGVLIKPCCLEETNWCSRQFPVLNGEDVRVATDFRNINKNIQRPTHPT